MGDELDIEHGEQKPTFDAEDNDDVGTTSNANESVATANTSVSASEVSERPPPRILEKADSSVTPEPPRWRFVREAKKTSGYSSHAAGSFVRGKSSQELGAKYIPPEKTYAERIAKKADIGELSAPDIFYSKFEKDQNDVGELSASDIKYPEFSKNQHEVGKLSINESSSDPEEIYEGGAVISHDPKDVVRAEKDPRIWVNYHARTKDSKGTNVDEKDKYTTIIESESTPERKYKGVGKLRFCPDDFLDGPFEGEIPKRQLEVGEPSDDITSSHELAHSNQQPLDTNKTKDSGFEDENEEGSQDDADHSSGDAGGGSDMSSKDDENSSKVMSEVIATDDPTRRRRRKLWLVLLLVPFIVIGAIVGGILGRREKSSPDVENMRAFPIGTTVSNDTVQPSSMPSTYPSEQSSYNETAASSLSPVASPIVLFRPGYSPVSNPPASQQSVILFDLPTSNPSTPPTSSPSRQPSHWPSHLPTTTPSSYPVTSAPTGQPIAFLGKCPEAFAPISYYGIGKQVQSEDVVYQCISFSCGTFGMDPPSDGWLAVGTCIGTVAPSTPESVTLSPTREPSQQPNASSKSPSAKPSQLPSRQPSQPPSESPSTHPVTAAPTSQPIGFLGACPEAFVPVSYYGVGKQVQSDGIVYQCISFSCGTFGMDPPSDGWLAVGTCSGTLTPSASNITPLPPREPSAKPSESAKPSQFPSKSPTSTPKSGSPTKRPSPITASPSQQPTSKPVTDSPTKQPFAAPSIGPSKPPTPYPSLRPVTLSPTKQPLAFLEGCPGNFIPLNEYTAGEQIESQGIVYECLSSLCTTLNDVWQVVGSCSGSMPPTSSSPTSHPTRQPSEQPTLSPSVAPSRSPTAAPTAGPTKSPSRSPTLQPSGSPTLGPSSSPSRSPSFGPSSNPSNSPTRQPSKTPTNSPSTKPTSSPSASPSELPSSSPSKPPSPKPTSNPTAEPSIQPSLKPTPITPEPTPQPTCAQNGNFNLCIAIDMSGSVCNGVTDGLCLECQPMSSCNSGGEKLTICCPNFSNMLSFTKNLVTSLGELSTDQDFSIVHFGTDVTVASSLESSRQSVKTINQLKYTGGKTNLAGAIDSCQETLTNSPPDRTNLMLVITDGAPSVPDFFAASVTTAAATNAKNQDTFIIPVLIEESRFGFSSEENFLKNSISSDGKVFVADFTGLNDLQDALFEQVTCQA